MPAPFTPRSIRCTPISARASLRSRRRLEAADPAAAGRAILTLADAANPPLRVFFGTQGYPMLQQTYADRLELWSDWQDLAAEGQGV